MYQNRSAAGLAGTPEWGDSTAGFRGGLKVSGLRMAWERAEGENWWGR